jgi:hypothetical protein
MLFAFRFTLGCAHFYQSDAVSAAFIAIVSRFIDALGDEVNAEAGFL